MSNQNTARLTLSIPEFELVGALLSNCQVHSNQAETLVELKKRVAAEAQALSDRINKAGQKAPPKKPPKLKK